MPPTALGDSSTTFLFRIRGEAQKTSLPEFTLPVTSEQRFEPGNLALASFPLTAMHNNGVLIIATNITRSRDA